MEIITPVISPLLCNHPT